MTQRPSARRNGAVALRAAVSANADHFAADLAPVIADIRAAGHVSLRAIAAELNARGMMTRRGGAWGVGNVKGVLARVREPCLSDERTLICSVVGLKTFKLLRSKMRYLTLPVLVVLTLLANCVEMSSDRAVVKGAGPEDLLKLRAGPGLDYKVIVGLPDGTQLTRHGCVTEVGQLWCQVTLTASPHLKGYVSADYLSASGQRLPVESSH